MFIAGDVELTEIELPNDAAVGAAKVREVPGGVGERDPHLNQLERIHIGFEGLVVVEGVGVMVVVAENDAGELCVHRDERETLDEGADEREFVLDVLGPDRADQDRFFGRVDIGQVRQRRRGRRRGWWRRLEGRFVGGEHGGVSRLRLIVIAEFGGKVRATEP